MKKRKQDKTTITVRLTDEEHDVLRRLCALKKTSRTGYLTNLAAVSWQKKPGWTCLPLWMKSLELRERTNGQWRDSYPQ